MGRHDGLCRSRPVDVPDRARRDTQVGKRVARIDRRPKPPEGRANLAAIKEIQTTVDLVRDATRLERIDDRLPFGAHGPHEDRLLLERNALGGVQSDNLVGDGSGLGGAVGGNPKTRQRSPVGGVGHQTLLGAISDRRDNRVGRVQDRLRRAVVALEANLGGVWKARPEVEDVLGRGAPEAIDALIVVADNNQAVASVGGEIEELRLGVVGVLELVDEDMAGRLTNGREAVGVGAKERDRVGEHRPEVLEAEFGQHRVMGPKHAGKFDLALRPNSLRWS